MSRAPFTFQHHAIERYIERYDATITLPVATSRLNAAACTATRLKRRTRTGEEVWILTVDSIRCDAIVRRNGSRAVCMTILPEGAADGYVHERRVSVPTPADPTGEALRILSRYVLANVKRGEERALRVVEQVQAFAPWIVSVPVAQENDVQGDGSDVGCGDPLRKDATGTEG